MFAFSNRYFKENSRWVPLYNIYFRLFGRIVYCISCCGAFFYQRQREELTSSSFSFLKGLNPLKEEDEGVIKDLLRKWLEKKIRPDGQVRDLLFF